MLCNHLEKIAQKMKWYDFAYLKLSMFFFTLFLVVVWPGFRNFVLGFQWYWLLILAIIAAIPLYQKFFE